VPTLPSGAGNTVQLENVILSRGFTSDPAKISLVWTGTGEAIGGLTR